MVKAKNQNHPGHYFCELLHVALGSKPLLIEHEQDEVAGYIVTTNSSNHDQTLITNHRLVIQVVVIVFDTVQKR